MYVRAVLQEAGLDEPKMLWEAGVQKYQDTTLPRDYITLLYFLHRADKPCLERCVLRPGRPKARDCRQAGTAVPE